MFPVLRALLLAGVLAAPAAAAHAQPREIEWVKCPWEHTGEPAPRCGYLVAPQTRGSPSDGTIRMFFSILPSRSSAPVSDPVVIVPGGPGALFNPPVAYVLDGLEEIRKQRDIIIVDQRGVGRSEPRLWCDENRRGPPHCLVRLKERGIDPAAFNTEETTRDLADLRRALGLARWNPMGASYGSRVVLRLMQVDPEGTRAVVSMASLPLGPSLARPDYAKSRRAALTLLFDACAADKACAAAYGALGEKVAALGPALKSTQPPPQLSAELWTFLRETDRDHGGIEAALIRRLDWTDELPRIPRAISDLHALVSEGKPLDRARIRAIYAGEGASSRIPPIDRSYIGASIRCREDVLPARAANGSASRPTLGPGSICSYYSAAPVADAPPPPPGPPLLLLSGVYDVRTPAIWSDEIAARTPGAILIKIGDSGHGISYRHPCANALMTDFIADPAAPLDRLCVAKHDRPRFEPPRG
jgi:pimeloyl-ACP methyl ester carboxylesterase